MPSLREVADQVCRGRAALLCLDTCTLLDVVTAPVRASLGADAVSAASAVVEAATRAVPALVPVASPFVPAERAAGLPKREKEAADKLRAWFASTSTVSDVLEVLTLPRVEPPAAAVVVQALVSLADRLLGVCEVLEPDADAQMRSLHRLQLGTRPCHEFRVSDALHLEHYLALARLVHAGDPNRRCVFVSGNTSDFAENGSSTRPHPDLVNEFNSAGLEYFPSLSSAIGSLLRTADGGATT